MPSVREQYDRAQPKPTPVGADTPDQTGITIKSNTIIGIEVEVENIPRLNNLVRPFWRTTNDGSLRNHGVEFISAPIRASQAPAALWSLMNESLPQEKCFSPRTSVHVHVDFTLDQTSTVIDMTLLYCVFEKLFYRFVGRNRIRNIYCVPITETNLVRQLGWNGLHPNIWQKYTGFNLRPIAEHGTIEFRHMHGTPDARKLAIWVDIITRLKDFVVAKGTKSIRSLIASLDDDFDYERLINEVFGERAADLGYTGLQDVSDGAAMAKMGLVSKGSFQSLAGLVTTNSPYFKVRKA